MCSLFNSSSPDDETYNTVGLKSKQLSPGIDMCLLLLYMIPRGDDRYDGNYLVGWKEHKDGA